MKDFRFYLEYPSKKDKRQATRKELGNHSINCIAIMPDTIRVEKNSIVYDCISAVFFVENSQCGGSSCSRGYLTEKCKRISEAQAKEIHPNLFIYLDE